MSTTTITRPVTEPKFSSYPYPKEGATGAEWRAWLEGMVGDLWHDIAVELTPLLNNVQVERFPVEFIPTFAEVGGSGWSRLDEGSWQCISPDDLPATMVLDVESIELQAFTANADIDAWLPCLCICYGADGYWYAWQEQNPMYCWTETKRRTIPFPTGCIVITQNGAAHDSQFLSSSYAEYGPERCLFIDVMALAMLVRGVHKEQRSQYEKYKVAISNGKPAPDWATQASDMDLASLASDVLGIEILKTVGGEGPQTLFEYCAQDVWVTLRLFQELWPLVANIYCPSPVILYGMAATTGLRYPVGDWKELVSYIETEYEKAKGIKPSKRDSNDIALVNWGKSHLRTFRDGYSVNGMTNMGFNPAHDVSGMPKSTIWSHHWMIRQFLITGVSDQPTTSYMLFEARVPMPIIPGNALAKTLASQPNIKTHFARPPEPVKANKKAKADWLQLRPLTDAMHVMICLIDCFCEEYEIDGFLAIPGLETLWYAVDSAQEKEFQECIAKAQSLVYKLMAD